MRKKKILLVDDSKSYIKIGRDFLTLSGYAVDVCEDGEQALSLIHNGYDLFILEINLPNINGFTLAKEIRKKLDTPIIFITFESEEYYKIQAFSCGADDYLTKPYLTLELLARIQAVLKRCDNYSGKVLHMNGITLDKKKMTAKVNGKNVDLTPTEFKLLQVFMENAGDVLSYNFLSDEAWDWPTDNCTNIIITNVSRLRNKIGKDKITNIRSIGYRFEE